MNILEKEIIATLAFFNSFEKALTVEEIFENLYKEHPLRQKPTQAELQKALKNLEAKKIIEPNKDSRGIKVQLKNHHTVDRTKYNNTLMNKTRRWSWIFTLCPFIELVAVCNTLGFDAAKKGSDIDLFIITTKGRLFTGRSFITLLTQLCGIRRHGDKVSERFCLSFLIDEQAKDIHRLAFNEDIYFTYWLKNLKVIYSRDSESIQGFSDINKYWVSQYLHHPHFNTADTRYGKNVIGKLLELLLKGKIGTFIENNLKKWQLTRARTKAKELPDLSGTILTDTILKFHNIDMRHSIHHKWKRTQRSISTRRGNQTQKKEVLTNTYSI